MKNLFKYLTMTVVALCTLSSCSDEDEPIVDLENITVENVTPLTEDGAMTVTLTVDPEKAAISGATTNAKGFEVEKLESKGNGLWQVTLKATNFLYIKNGQTIELVVSQSNGLNARADVTVNDPFSIEDKYDLACPLTYSLTDAKTGEAIGLPMIVTAKDKADLAKIDKYIFMDMTFDNGSTTIISNGWQCKWFELKPIENVYGAYLVAKQEAVEKMSTQKVPQNLGVFCLAIVADNGRVKHCQLDRVFACPSVGTLKDDALQVAAADLKKADFKQEGEIDGSNVAARVGLRYIGDDKGDIASSKYSTEELGMFFNGTLLENENFFLAGTNPTFLTDYKLDYQFYGQPEADYVAGTYLWKMYYNMDWKYDGATYPRIRANIEYNITIK